MKLWIIYYDGMIISKIIAEMIQNLLIDYIDVAVGNINKIEPSYLLEEKLDYLIIGDIISDTAPSLELQNWLLKYHEVSKNNDHAVNILSGFYISLTDINNNDLWIKFLQENVSYENIFTPMLCLQLRNADLAKINSALELVEDYSNDFLKSLLNDTIK